MTKFENEETSFTWEKDPLHFVFNDYQPGQIKMHIKRLDVENWVKIDSTYIDQMKVRKGLITSKREQVYVSKAGDEVEACKQELFEMLIEYLPQRYPDIFEQRDNKIYNKVFLEGISTDLNDLEDPLIQIGQLVQEDWLILQWDSSKNAYVLTAGLLCFPMRWTLAEKFNNSLSFIHSPVTLFMEHLSTKVNKLFKDMKPSTPVWRANWGIYHDLNGALDLFAPPPGKSFIAEYGKKTGLEILLRHEYQTLRKLPRTKCVVFSIRTYQRPLKEFESFPLIYSKNLLAAIEDLGEEMALYKGAPKWKDATVTYLNSVIRQKENEVKWANSYVIQNWKFWGTCFISVLFSGLFYFGRNKKFKVG